MRRDRFLLLCRLAALQLRIRLALFGGGFLVRFVRGFVSGGERYRGEGENGRDQSSNQLGHLGSLYLDG